MRRWTTRVVQEFEYDAETADEALALAHTLQTRPQDRCLLVDFGAYTAEKGSNASWQTNPSSVAAALPVPETQP